MKVVITGGSGFLGQVLAREVLARKRLRAGPDELVAVTCVVLADLTEPNYLFDLPSLAESSGVRLSVMTGDVSDAAYCASLVASCEEDADEDVFDALSIFHLGAVMSGAPPDLALRVNLHGTMNMLEAARSWRTADDTRARPTFVFSSAGATLGSGHPADWVKKGDTISDSTRAAPHTTYGTTKACAELLLADYSRREFVDGRGVRLPSVVVRAGAPNAATTGCFSSVVREPLSGVDVSLPVGPDLYHAVTGYRAAVGGMLAVHDAPSGVVDELLGYDRTVFLPTRSVSLRQLEGAMRNVVEADSAAKLGGIAYEEDAGLSSVVGSFPTKVDSSRAIALGAPATPSVEDMIREFCEDFPDAVADGVRLVPRRADEAFDPAARRVVAVITGAGSGIGRAVAVRLARGGWGGADGRGNGRDGETLRVSLVLAGRRPDPLLETKGLCSEYSVDVLAVPTDVTSERDVANLTEAVKRNFGRIDLLFNNAGINIPPASAEAIEPDDFRRVIDTNVTAVWRMAKAAMSVMSAQDPPRGGRIINNGSISAHSPRPGSAPYTASKHAVLGLTKSLALDGRTMGVTVGQVDFGNVSSEMTSAVGGSGYSMGSGMPQADGSVRPEPTFRADDAAGTVWAMAALPPGANVLGMTVVASQMPFVGRG